MKAGVDHLKSLWLTEPNEEDAESRKAMYQFFRMLLADIEGDFELRDKLILDPTSDQMTNVSDGWRRYLRLKSGKANHNDLVISEAEIRGTNELRRLEDFFNGSKLKYAGNHEFYAELYLARFTQGQTSWISSLHAERAWELNNRQAMSAMMLRKSMIAQKKYAEIIDILKNSIPFSSGFVKKELERDLELAQRRWKNEIKDQQKVSKP